MTVRDIKPGTIVETLPFGITSGRYYKLGDFNGYSYYAYCRFTGHRVTLHPTVQCRIATDDFTNGHLDGFEVNK